LFAGRLAEGSTGGTLLVLISISFSCQYVIDLGRGRRGMNYTSQQRKPPLVRYSTQNRAVLLSSAANSMPRARRARATSRPGQKRSVATVRRVRIVKGRVVLNKVSGHPGTHRFGAGQLIRFVPLNKIKLAAKRILGSPSRSRRRRGRGGGRRRRRKTKRLKKRVGSGRRRRRRRRLV
jgi:hypothetical protein